MELVISIDLDVEEEKEGGRERRVTRNKGSTKYLETFLYQSYW